MPAMIRLGARLGPKDAQDDIVQEALLRAWRHRGRYDSSRGSFSAWLMTIVANEAHRATARERRPVVVAPYRDPASSDERLDIDAALITLTPRQRLAIDCFYFAGLSVADTAQVMRCSQGTVKSTLADARGQLRRKLEER